MFAYRHYIRSLCSDLPYEPHAYGKEPYYYQDIHNIMNTEHL